MQHAYLSAHSHRTLSEVLLRLETQSDIGVSLCICFFSVVFSFCHRLLTMSVVATFHHHCRSSYQYLSMLMLPPASAFATHSHLIPLIPITFRLSRTNNASRVCTLQCAIFANKIIFIFVQCLIKFLHAYKWPSAIACLNDRGTHTHTHIAFTRVCSHQMERANRGACSES